MIKNKEKFNVAVIGGGPAGMMAAGQASAKGARVVLLEKNNRLGIKLLATGGGRCNLTNNIAEPRQFIERIGHNGKFLFSALHKFGVRETRDFFTQLGVSTRVEENGRVFPESNRATDVLHALVGFLQENKVKIKYNAAVIDFIIQDKKIVKIILQDGSEVMADNYIVCTGGKSYPATGSSGEIFVLLEKMGHRIIQLTPALTPIIVREKIIKKLEGISFNNLSVTIYNDKKKIATSQGEAIFTANGLSGPMILDLSRYVFSAPSFPASSSEGRGSMVRRNDVDSLPLRFASAGNDSKKEVSVEESEYNYKINTLALDFLPNFSIDELDRQLQKDFQEDGNKMTKNILEKYLPARLVVLLLHLSAIANDKKANEIKREQRQKIISLIKNFSLAIQGSAGFEKAMVTAGGVDLREINPQTMCSKTIDNLFFAGEVLDLIGPTGGFNLQICWSTGFVAGDSVCK